MSQCECFRRDGKVYHTERCLENETLRAKVKRLREVIGMVEWVLARSTVSYGHMDAICPWCGGLKLEGHSPDCPREEVLEERAETAEAERDSLLMVEWVPHRGVHRGLGLQGTMRVESSRYCPWCDNLDIHDHAPDCVRQAAMEKK